MLGVITLPILIWLKGLCKAWHPRRFKLSKIKSHQSMNDVEDLMMKRWIMGNAVADTVAAKAIERCPEQLLSQARHIKDF